MTARPDFSPDMLRFFLRARALVRADGKRGGGRVNALQAFKARMRREAGVTAAELDLAWMGRLQSPLPRARLWAVLGHHPVDHGLMLTHGGQEAADA